MYLYSVDVGKRLVRIWRTVEVLAVVRLAHLQSHHLGYMYVYIDIVCMSMYIVCM